MYGKGRNVTLVLLVARNFECRIFPYIWGNARIVGNQARRSNSPTYVCVKKVGTISNLRDNQLTTPCPRIGFFRFYL